MVVKTFRGQLADDGQDQIHLSTIKGKMGYKIIKFQAMPDNPMIQDQENVLKIYKTKQTTVDGTVDFSDGDLLGALASKFVQGAEYAQSQVVVFDTEIFNQDIYVTNEDVGAGGRKSNYYIELEVIPLTDQGAEYTTLKDIRTQLTIS